MDKESVYTIEKDSIDIKGLERKAASGDLTARLALTEAYNIRGEYEKALKLEESLLEEGESDMAFNAANKYLYGIGTCPDRERALALLEEAKNGGNMDAGVMLAVMELDSQKAESDMQKCIEKLKDYASQGNAEALRELAERLSEGRGMEKNVLEAERYFKESIKTDSPESFLSYGMFIVMHADEIGEKPETGFRYMKKAALLDYAAAMFYVAVYYMAGFGVKKNLANAIKWFEKTDAEQIPERDLYLGLAYFERRESESDEQNAFECFKKAETKGAQAGTYMMAKCIMEGVGTEKSERRAKSLVRESAAAGNALCERMLGNWYRDGAYYKQNYKTAATWYRKAFDKGDVYAGTELGKLYFYGYGVKKNMKKAFEILCDAANLHERGAQEFLAQCYKEGLGTEKNAEVADEWMAFGKETDAKYRNLYPEAWMDILRLDMEV